MSLARFLEGDYMTYCISDVHGCYDELMRLLKKIDFSADDTLYLLGDIIDRGPNSIKCLEFARTTPNVIFILGNHEQMLLDYFTGKEKEVWLQNGGDKTLKEAKKMLGRDKASVY
jgi:serine/threonine protein phosphatase 1